jgi:cytochrome c oxidase subunit 1
MSRTRQLAAKYKSYFYIFLFLLAICNLPFSILWIHHRLITGVSPFLGSLFLFLVLLILFPVTIRLIKWAGKNWIDVTYESCILFGTGLISWIIYLPPPWNSYSGFQFHDTYYMLSIFSVVLAGSFFFGIFCMVYYLLPRISGYIVNITYARIHFWISYWGLCYIFWKIHVDQTTPFSGEGSQPRRYVEYSGWADYKYLEASNRHLLIAVILVLAAQVLFILNFIYSMTKERREKL